jgi:hypothetical protein
MVSDGKDISGLSSPFSCVSIVSESKYIEYIYIVLSGFRRLNGFISVFVRLKGFRKQVY